VAIGGCMAGVGSLVGPIAIALSIASATLAACGSGSRTPDGASDVASEADAAQETLEAPDGTEPVDVIGELDDVASDTTEAPADTAVDMSCSGLWQPCCVDGLLASCCCPSGVACNYFYTDCGNGTCATLANPCPGDGGA